MPGRNFRTGSSANHKEIPAAHQQCVFSVSPNSGDVFSTSGTQYNVFRQTLAPVGARELERGTPVTLTGSAEGQEIKGAESGRSGKKGKTSEG
ncbi:hypothetical protein TNCV_2901481 [Trichonephila clavipes]|nr:hypothetical protein TNCV_2901481 [Trichonephila clavipes]